MSPNIGEHRGIKNPLDPQDPETVLKRGGQEKQQESVKNIAAERLHQSPNESKGAPVERRISKKIRKQYSFIEAFGDRVTFTPFTQSAMVEIFDKEWEGSCNALAHSWMYRKMRAKDFQAQTTYEITDSHLPHPVVAGDNKEEGKDIQDVQTTLKEKAAESAPMDKAGVEEYTEYKGVEALINVLGDEDYQCAVLGTWYIDSKGVEHGHAVAFAKRGDECAFFDPNIGEVTFKSFRDFKEWFEMEVMEGTQALFLQVAVDNRKKNPESKLFFSDIANSGEFSDDQKRVSKLAEKVTGRIAEFSESSKKKEIVKVDDYELDIYVFDKNPEEIELPEL